MIKIFFAPENISFDWFLVKDIVKYCRDKGIHIDIEKDNGLSITHTLKRQFKITPKIFKNQQVRFIPLSYFLKNSDKYDLVIFQDNLFLLGKIISLRLFRKPKRLILIDNHFFDHSKKGNFIPTRKFIKLQDFSDIDVCYTHYYKPRDISMYKKYGIVKNKIQSRYYSIDTDYFKSNNKKTPSNYFVSIGTTHRDYSHLFKVLKKISLKIQCKIITQLSFKKVPNCVEILNFQPLHKFKKIIDNSLFVVIPLHSYRTTAGITSFLIASSLGVPSLVRKNKVMEQYLKDEYNGIFYSNKTDLEKKIKLLATNFLKRKKIGKNAQKETETKYSNIKFIEKLFKKNLK